MKSVLFATLCLLAVFPSSLKAGPEEYLKLVNNPPRNFSLVVQLEQNPAKSAILPIRHVIVKHKGTVQGEEFLLLNEPIVPAMSAGASWTVARGSFDDKFWILNSLNYVQYYEVEDKRAGDSNRGRRNSLLKSVNMVLRFGIPFDGKPTVSKDRRKFEWTDRYGGIRTGILEISGKVITARFFLREDGTWAHESKCIFESDEDELPTRIEYRRKAGKVDPFDANLTILKFQRLEKKLPKSVFYPESVKDGKKGETSHSNEPKR